MLQDSSQNDTLSTQKLKIWLDWLNKNTAHVNDTADIARDKKQPDIEIPDSIFSMLRCIISIPSVGGPSNIEQEKLQECLETLQNNQEDVHEFFKSLQNKPTVIISLMQKLGRPLPLPLKDLIRAMEEVANDSTETSTDFREAIVTYLELMKRQQAQFVSLMQDSVEIVAGHNDNRQGGEQKRGFIDEWVQVFESKFVHIAKQDEYAKDLGALINASVRVLKEQKRYRNNLTLKT